MSAAVHRVLIVGGGFAGLHAVRRLRRAPVAVTLIDRQNHHLFQPLLYQVATGALSPANIASPLRAIFRRQKNVEVLLGEIVDFDLDHHRVVLDDGQLEYDTLIVAAGAANSYFGHDDWESPAPGLKTLDDATAIRGQLLSSYEKAEREHDRSQRSRLLTFAVIGAGPTGVELAGAMGELARHTLRHDFRNIDPAEARILLIDAAPRVLMAYPERLSAKAEHFLERLGVTVVTKTKVTAIRPGQLNLEVDGRYEQIEAETILWSAGIRAAPIAESLARALNVETPRAGRIPVDPYLRAAGRTEVFVVGDMADCSGPDGEPLPSIAPVAIQQGRYVADSIRKRLAGKSVAEFQYRDRGSLATIGRSAAVAKFGTWGFAGLFAWIIWLFVHLMQLVQFQNRVLVFTQWAWNYLTHSRAARLITGRRSVLQSSQSKSD